MFFFAKTVFIPLVLMSVDHLCLTLVVFVSAK
uniref:Uncharacterized protein n=1 Tax=Rhizophora mucronata TaxID=61149 RepID=A0A2P2N5A4_RHIMU